MDAYRFICSLRSRGVSLRVEAGRLVKGRWRGGFLVASPGRLLNETDRTLLRQLNQPIRGLLPYVTAAPESEPLVERCYHCGRSRFGEHSGVCKRCGLPGASTALHRAAT